MITTESPLPVTILARAVEPGLVKTRLARDVGEDRAAAIHEALTLDLIEGLPAATRGARLVLALTGGDAACRELGCRAVAACPGLVVERQAEGDLGERINASLERRIAEGAGASCVVGADCPLLDAPIWTAVAGALEGGADVVLVPARDGGFALLAASRLPEGSWHGVEWGGPRVLEQAAAALARRGAAVHRVGAADDVDDLDGLRRLAGRLAGGDAPCPRTRGWLRENGWLPGGA